MKAAPMLTTEVDGAVGWIVLRGDPVHAMTEEFPGQLLAAVEQLDDAPDVRAVVLTGMSKVFCAGADVSLMPKMRSPSFGRSWLESHNAALVRLAEWRLPTVCAVNGAAAGAGFNLALACDLVLAARTARFNQAFVKIGLAPDMGSYHLLPRRVGFQRARELMYTGRFIDAEEAHALGAVDEVVEPADLRSRARSLAGELADGPTCALSAIKAGIESAAGRSLRDSLAIETEQQLHVFRSEDFEEGSQAFLEKRPPRFTGR